MPNGPALVEIREPGRAPRQLMVSGPVTFGRDGAGEVLADAAVSRQHVRLVPSPTALSVVDLGSRNGTAVNGVALTGRAALARGDVVRLGRTEIIVLYVPTAEQESGGGATIAAIPVQAPPPPAAPAALPRWVRVANRALGIDPSGTRNLFPASTELRSRVPRPVWQAVRIASIASYLAVVVAMFVRPAGGLFVFFGIVVPLLPGLFLIAPGLWRNSCPLAATNQIPRVLRFTRGGNPPEWLRRRGYQVSVTLFLGIAGARLAGLDRIGAAAGVALSAVALAAFAGGVLYKGKSGWCSSICPLFSLQRVYGQTPFVTVPNTHCEPCVGCAKNCFDFTPRAAYQADLADPERSWSAPRKLFAAALPGFVLGFFTLTGDIGTAVVQRYSVLALFMLVTVGVFFALEAMTPVSPAMLSAGYAAVALNVFYWFSGVTLARSFSTITGVSAPWLHWPISAVILLATAVWLLRTRVVELQYATSTGARTEPVLLPFPKRRMPEKSVEPTISVVFEPGGQVTAEEGMSLLEAAERTELPIEAGCRMGVCGADPVAVLAGADCLSAIGREERNTLRRLGFADNTRMACCARIGGGTVRVSPTPEPGRGGGTGPRRFDRSIVSCVVIGNGIAGVTAADFLRRGHPNCEIHLVGREAHAFYNRMGISRLVYGRSAMQGLYLLPEQWYDDHQVTAWLNTLVTSIDLAGRRVFLGTGDALPYDRLVLAMGASSALPPVEGLSRPGCFVLRDADDAMLVRSYVQEFRCARAVVAGGGLLGLEAAYALHLLGLQVTVLERGERLLARQLDPRCSDLVLDHFTRAGIQVLRRAETAAVTGDPVVQGVILSDGRRLACEVFLTATGIRPNIELARRARIPVGRGILVDDGMRTGVPGVFAAGDVAEHQGQVFGLWPIAAEQAQVAADNALGGSRSLVAEVPATILKGVGLELFSIGRVRPGRADEEIVVDRPGSYRRLLLSEGRAAGATILGHHPAEIAAAQRAVREHTPIPAAARAALRSGDWSVLESGATTMEFGAVGG
ncbi:FHA domain-containing protein [Nocardia terpenica]|uniref:FHA domain-containing protein n=2 Tax=Nocardia terpenica TaxID=455432 RepID=A0A6G9ZEN9_9NOCA|nr:FHA domain-containing protein [Nocardia terpenica]